MLKKNILKDKYFNESKQKLHVRRIMIMIIIPALILFFDLVENRNSGAYNLTIAVIVLSLYLITLFIAFLRIGHHRIINHLLLGFYTLFSSTLLFIPNKHPELVLFGFILLPVTAFFLLGLKEGIKWVIGILGLLIAIFILTQFNIVHIAFDDLFIIELIIGYLIISYIIYVIELERDRSEDDLHNILNKNKLLFKEMHHRTKNNMQVMMGLLETQSFKISDPKCQKLFYAHIDRIKAMSYVHENLYTGTSVDEVDMNKYLGEILKNLQTITKHTIISDVEYITLDIKTSMNLGLIVNEAVTNAIEHAYSVGIGRIDVSLKRRGDYIELQIRDYGLGYNPKKGHESLGMTMIEDMSASLPEGKLSIIADEGTTITVSFKEK